jgi:hypothetical protein
MWRVARNNEDIAAVVIGFVRQVALGDPLSQFGPWERILAEQSWNGPQLQWQRIHASRCGATCKRLYGAHA